MQATPKILIVDDDTDLVTLLTDYLTLEGFSVTAAHTGSEALSVLNHNTFDLIVLDVMMPGMSGIEVLSRIRETMTIPVLMLTARGDSVDRILGLELGADDYVPKPCPPRELVARMRAILRRSLAKEEKSKEIRVGKLVIDTAHRTVTYDTIPVVVTGTELSLLEILARHALDVVSKSDLYPEVLGRPMGRYDRAIDVHISSVRQKLQRVADDALRIESIRGVGYQLIHKD